MSTEIIKKDSNKRVDWDKVKEELKVSGICRALLKKSHFRHGCGAFSVSNREIFSKKSISITLPCSKDADLEEQEFYDEAYNALEIYFSCSIHLIINYNDGTEICQE